MVQLYLPAQASSTLATEAAPDALSTIKAIYPSAVEQSALVDKTAAALAEFGFTSSNCIPIVSVCRDEICRPLELLIGQKYGLTFAISGLGGVPSCGKTGVLAAMSHSPQVGKKERYIFFAFTHIGVDEKGEVGHVLRIGREKASHACGALLAITGALPLPKEVPLSDDDIELDLLKAKIAAKEPEKDLVAVTKSAVNVIDEVVEDLVSKTVDISKADYAVITGVQIHSGCNDSSFTYDKAVDYIAPSLSYVVVNGEKKTFTL